MILRLNLSEPFNQINSEFADIAHFALEAKRTAIMDKDLIQDRKKLYGSMIRNLKCIQHHCDELIKRYDKYTR